MRHTTIGGHRYTFNSLPTLLAHATPARSGDRLAGIAAPSEEARVAAQIALADLPLTTFLNEPVVPYKSDEVTRLIINSHNTHAFAPISHLTVGGPRLAALRRRHHRIPGRARPGPHARNGRGGQ